MTRGLKETHNGKFVTKKLDFDVINKLSCSVYRIEKVEPFNDKDLSTIQTVIKQVK